MEMKTEKKNKVVSGGQHWYLKMEMNTEKKIGSKWRFQDRSD